MNANTAEGADAELVAENRRLKGEVGRLGIGCRHLLACFDYSVEEDAPLSEIDEADRALIEDTRRVLATISGAGLDEALSPNPSSPSGQSSLCEHGHTDPMTSCNQCSACEIEGTVSPSPEQSDEQLRHNLALIGLSFSATGLEEEAATISAASDALESAQAEIARLTAMLREARKKLGWSFHPCAVAAREAIDEALATLKGNQP